MNFRISNLRIFDVSNRSRAISFIIEVFCTVIFLSSAASMTNAAITWTGNLNPADPTTWTSSTEGYIGQSSAGTISVNGGSVLLSKIGYLGYSSGSSGEALVTGAGSTWKNTGSVFIGCDGSGILNIVSGGQVNNYTGYLGYNSGSVGTTTVTGTNSKWSNSYSLYVGNYGDGTLNIKAGGEVSNSYECFLGRYSGSTGIVTVTGIGSKWTNTGGLKIGDSGNGTLMIIAGGQVSDSGCYLGYNTGSKGTATVTGPGSSWTNNGLVIGYSGTGELMIEAGGQVICNNSINIGFNSGSTGTATVTGYGSRWTSIYSSYIGYSGVGILNIAAGGLVDNPTGSCFLGYYPGSSGTVAVSGTGSAMNCGALFVGYDGNGTLSVSNGAEITVSGALYASLSNLFGNGIINTKGAVLDADIVLDRTTGPKQSIAFGTGGILNLDIGDTVKLGTGYKGLGSLRITEGILVTSNSGTLGMKSGSTGTATVTDGGTWTCHTFYVGESGNGNLIISAGGQVISGYPFIGYNAGSNGTVTVTGAYSSWTTNNHDLYVGNYGTGTLNIEAGGNVSNYNGYIGQYSASKGTVNVSGSGSSWTNNDYLYIGYAGIGVLNIEAGGVVTNSAWSSYIGYDPGSSGSVKVIGTGSQWFNNNNLYVGYSGNGTLTIQAGGQVSNTESFIGLNTGSVGTVLVAGIGSKWVNSGDLSVGRVGSGSLTVTDGGMVSAASFYASLSDLYGNGTITAKGVFLGADLVFDSTHELQQTISFGTGGKLNISLDGTGILGVGWKSNGTLRIADGITVKSSYGGLGYFGSIATATVTGNGTKWAISNTLYVNNGTLNIEAGGQVSNYSSIIGGNYTTVNVTGYGSKWTVTDRNSIGSTGNGTLNIRDGGQVSSDFGILGENSGYGSALVTGTDSLWDNSKGDFNVGYSGTGTLNVENHGQVIAYSSKIGSQSGSTGTGTVVGNGSKWITYHTLYIGNSGKGTLNIGIGGLVSAENITISTYSGGNGTCNMNGGTLLVGGITKGSGPANFNWNDGTVQNFDTSTNLTIASNMVLKLAATGTHAFNIDLNRIATVNGIMSNATSGGTLEKRGAGLLTLTAQNTYTGGTTIREGTLALSSTGSLASSMIDVGSGATFDISAKTGGFTLGAGKTLKGSGTVAGSLIVNGIHAPGSSPGIETVKGNYSILGELQIELMGTAAGTGYDQVLLPVNGTTKYNATLGGILILDWTGMNGSTGSTKLWIIRNDTAGTLSGTFGNYANGAALGRHDGWDWRLWYGADAATGKLFGGNDVAIAAVPEPMGAVLLGIGALLLLGWAWRRR